MNKQDLIKTLNGILEQEFDTQLLLNSKITGKDYTDVTVDFFSDKVTDDWVKNNCVIGNVIDLSDEGYEQFEKWYSEYRKMVRSI